MFSEVLLSTAYLPPVSYFSLIAHSGAVIIEKEENFIKQTYRNRCCILSSHGQQALIVPVLEGSRRKVRITDVRIDYSKRWQQVHLRAITAAYRSSPYFDFYFGKIEEIISAGHEYLFRLNSYLLEAILEMLKIERKLQLSPGFRPVAKDPDDFRYRIEPGKKPVADLARYIQVFDSGNGFVPDLSIMDLIFNTGPEAVRYL